MAHEFEDAKLISQLPGGPGPGGPCGPGPGGPGGMPGMMPPPPPFAMMHGFGPGPGGMGPGPMMLPLHDLDLSDEQVEKLAAIKSSTADKAGPIMLKLHSAEREYRLALVQPEINRDQVSKLQAQLATQKQALDAVFGEAALDSAQVLTVEQRKQLKQKMNRMELGPAVAGRKALQEKK
ncbi:MAG: periplasmic heavy metal sensor [Cyanobacteria bacterium SZAS LIN-3]|nr:periplasmic heavy metal sensor [Cyanobacteria bacterium SZAS LIN-3]